MTRYPPWYAWAALVCSLVASIGLNLVVNGRLIDRARESQGDAVCAVTVAQDEVYRETPPKTEAGRNAAQAWANMRALYRCDQR